MREAARLFLVLAASLLGALFALGAIIAARLESDGFTTASASGPRSGYLALLIGGLVASVAVPSALAVWAYPDRRTPILTAATVALVVGLVLFVAAAR